MDRPPPPPQHPHPGSRAPQVVLAVFVAVLAAMLGLRAYGNRLGARPTDHVQAVGAPVDLNTADEAELVQLPDVGPALADAILTHRRDHGRFAAVDDLTAVKGIGPKTLTRLRPWLTVSEPATTGTAGVDPDVAVLERKPVAPPPPPPPVAGSGKLRPGDPPLDVNSATEADLMRLPGVGPTLAGRIVEARGLDRFQTPEDLRRVKGIGPKTLEGVRQYVVCR